MIQTESILRCLHHYTVGNYFKLADHLKNEIDTAHNDTNKPKGHE